MKLFQNLLIALVILFNLAIAQPSFADKPPVTDNPDYVAVTEALGKTIDPTAIAKLQFEKYIIETGEPYAECRNETGSPIAIYGGKTKTDKSTFDNALYLLPDGEATDEDWNCQGIYLANGLNNDGSPVAAKIVSGTQLVAKANPDTGAIELNIPPANVFKSGEINWAIPETTQAFAELALAQAPTD